MKGKSSKKLINSEKGQALIVVLVMMLFGSLVLAPVLAHVGTGLKAGEYVYEERMELLYAADAGVEDALWQINNKSLADFLPGYDEFAYSDYDPDDYKWTYRPAEIYSENVNGKDVKVTIENIWIPKDMPAPSKEVGRSIIEEGKLLVFGSLAGTSQVDYKIKIAFYWGSTAEKSNLTVQKMGIWLPAGFSYVEGTANFNSNCTPSSVEVESYKSGEVVVWEFNSPPLAAFPGSDGNPCGSDNSCPMVAAVTFQFLGPSGQNPAEAVSWIDTSGVSGVDYAWDADTKVYGITSEAKGELGKEATVEAHAAKIEMRDLGSTIIGDYLPIGATLMTATGTGWWEERYRDRLYLQTDATVGATDIPENATIDSAYLYWSGWIDYYYAEQYGTDGHGNPVYRWSEIPELKYDNYVNNLTELVEQNAKVNTVTVIFGSGDPVTVTSNQWQVTENAGQADVEGSWSYSCFYDVTDLVKSLIDNEKLGSNASGTYALEHAWVDEQRTGVGADEYYFDLCNTSGPTGHKTGYPLSTPAHKRPDQSSYMNRYQLSNAGWSLILIYSTPGEERRQLYLFDTFRYVRANTTVSFTISGFLAPEDTTGSKLTYFVGDGDAHWGSYYMPDCITVEGSYLHDTTNPWYNVFNSESNAIDNPVYKSGIDVDTFDMSAYIVGGDPSADVVIDSGEFLYLVYIILCFRSEVTAGGTISYLIY